MELQDEPQIKLLDKFLMTQISQMEANVPLEPNYILVISN